jgi:hypothetical protein
MGTYPYPPADEARDPNTYEPASFADVLIEELGLIEARRRVIHGRSTGRLERADLADEDVPDPKTRPQLARVEFRKEKAEAGEADDEDSYLAFTRIKALDLNVTGLAFSGGGIRSATFAVGFLQGLAGLKLLRFFDVLSTVSGGGYAGSWWTTWVRRVGDPINVEYQLDPNRIAQMNADRGPRLTSSAAEIDPKPPP